MKQKLYLFVALLCAVTQGTWGQTGQTIDLSTLTNNSSYTIPDGATVTGTLTVTGDKHCEIFIAADATITLSGVDINGQGEFVADQAGLTCLGDATIILADGTTNTICPFSIWRPAVYIPEDYTLTIQGTPASSSVKAFVLNFGDDDATSIEFSPSTINNNNTGSRSTAFV